MKEAPAVKEINPAAKCEQMCIAVDDTEQEDLLSWFEQAIEFIKKGREADGILVHCIQGVSRSSTACFPDPAVNAQYLYLTRLLSPCHFLLLQIQCLSTIACFMY